MYKALYKAFDILNKQYFDNELPKPFITLMKKRENNLGHFTVDKIWFNQTTKEERWEININPLNTTREPKEIIGTLLHEMCHEYCAIHKIKDIKSNKHSEDYAKVCFAHGLNCEYDEKLGWAITSLTEDCYDYLVEEKFFEEFTNDFWFRQEPEKPKPRKVQYKYT